MFSVLNFPYLLCRYNCKWKTSEMFRLGWAKDTKPIGLDASSRYVVQQTKHERMNQMNSLTWPSGAETVSEICKWDGANDCQYDRNANESGKVLPDMQIYANRPEIILNSGHFSRISRNYAKLCKNMPEYANVNHYQINLIKFISMQIIQTFQICWFLWWLELIRKSGNNAASVHQIENDANRKKKPNNIYRNKWMSGSKSRSSPAVNHDQQLTHLTWWKMSSTIQLSLRHI